MLTTFNVSILLKYPRDINKNRDTLRILFDIPVTHHFDAKKYTGDLVDGEVQKAHIFRKSPVLHIGHMIIAERLPLDALAVC